MRGKGFPGSGKGASKDPVARESKTRRDAVSVKAEHRADDQ